MSTREYLDEVIEVLKEEYGVSQERAEKMIDDTYFAFKIEFNPYMYSDMALSDVARLIVKTFSNVEFKYQRFYDRVVEHIIRYSEVNANTAFQVMSFNNSKELYMNNVEEIDKMGMFELAKFASNLYQKYQERQSSFYFKFYISVRSVLIQEHGLNLDEANNVLRFYNLELVYNNLKSHGDVDAFYNTELIAKSAIRYFVRHKYNELNGLG